ncbi:hypothetical protein ACSBO6_18365 [Bacillus sp. AL-1R]
MGIHDNEIIGYEVELAKNKIILHTVSETNKYIDVLFTDVLAHYFETQIPGSILFGIDESDVSKFCAENEQLLEKQKDYCWPMYYDDVFELQDFLMMNRYKYYEIMASYGLSGWILAKNYEMTDSEN